MHLHCTPTAAAQVGYVESLLLLEALAEARLEEAKFDAALHGRKLR